MKKCLLNFLSLRASFCYEEREGFELISFLTLLALFLTVLKSLCHNLILHASNCNFYVLAEEEGFEPSLPNTLKPRFDVCF